MHMKFLLLNQQNKPTQDFIKVYQNSQTKEVPQALKTIKGKILYKNILIHAKQGSGLNTLLLYLEKVLKVKFLQIYPEDIDEIIDKQYYRKLYNQISRKQTLDQQLFKQKSQTQMLVIHDIEQFTDNQIKNLAKLEIPVIFIIQTQQIQLRISQLLQQNSTLIYRLQNDDDKCMHVLNYNVNINDVKNYNYNITFIKNNLILTNKLNPISFVVQNNIIFSICNRQPEYMIGLTNYNQFTAQSKLIQFGVPKDSQYGTFQQFSFLLNKIQDQCNVRVIINKLIALEIQICQMQGWFQEVGMQLIQEQLEIISIFSYNMQSLLMIIQGIFAQSNIFNKSIIYESIFKQQIPMYDQKINEINLRSDFMQYYKDELQVNTDSAILNIYEQNDLEQQLVQQAIRSHNAEIISDQDLELLKEAILVFNKKPSLMNVFDKNTAHAVNNLISAQYILPKDINNISENQVYIEKIALLDQRIHEMQVMSKNEQETMKYTFHNGCTQAVMINCTINDLL